MDIIKISAVGITAVCVCLLLKSERAELGILISLAAAAVIVIYSLPYLKEVLSALQSLSDFLGIESAYITPIFKALGIAYITQMGSDLAKDAGETAIASKIDLAGKIFIISLAFPIAYKMISVVNGIIFSV